ncbi:MAG TPA: response regulator [Verrucomicrobiae bacterium]|nr:response regulator [Verrucomicrobiae bacterium]
MSQSAKKVLLVDDSDADAYLISTLVGQTEGLKLVWRASDGHSAMMYLDGIGGFRDRSKFPVPDVVLLDLNMPNGNGYEVLEQLKTRSEKPKVVILTCCDDPVAERKAMDLGADAFKVKPYEVLQYGQLIQWLRSWLDEDGAPESSLLTKILKA